MAENYHIIHNEGEAIDNILKVSGEFDKAQEDIEVLKKRANEGGELDRKIDAIDKETNGKIDSIKTETDAKIPDNLMNAEGLNSIKSTSGDTTALGDDAFAFGTDSFVGRMGFYYKAIDPINNRIYLSKSSVTPIVLEEGYDESSYIDSTFETPESAQNTVGYHTEFLAVLKEENKAAYRTWLSSTIEKIENNVIYFNGAVDSTFLGLVEGKYEIKAHYITIAELPGIGEVEIPVIKGGIALGINTAAGAEGATAIGFSSYAVGQGSHAEGYCTLALGTAAHTEGYFTKTQGDFAHAEGRETLAEGIYSHAEGYATTAEGRSSHAEGEGTKASVNTHAEGYYSIAEGRYSHAEGSNTYAKHLYSHAEGMNTITTGRCQHVQGRYNAIEDTENKYAHIVGNGTSANKRSNAHTLDWDGNAWYQGGVTTDKIIPTLDNELVTKNYVDNKNVISYTYAELKELKEAGNLKRGQAYLISDFQSSYRDPYKTVWGPAPGTFGSTGSYVTTPGEDGIYGTEDDTVERYDYVPVDNVGLDNNTYISEVEPLVVIASSENTFFDKVYSTTNPDHDIYYHFEHKKDYDYVFKWATNNKGMIVRRLDERGNDFPYDFVNMRFRGYDLDLEQIGAYNSAIPYEVGDLVETSDNEIYVAIKNGFLSNPTTMRNNEWIYVCNARPELGDKLGGIKLPNSLSFVLYNEEGATVKSVSLPIKEESLTWVYTFNGLVFENAYEWSFNTKVYCFTTIHYMSLLGGSSDPDGKAAIPRFFNVTYEGAGGGCLVNNYFENSSCIISSQLKNNKFLHCNNLIIEGENIDNSIFDGVRGSFRFSDARNIEFYSNYSKYPQDGKIYDLFINFMGDASNVKFDNFSNLPRGVFWKVYEKINGVYIRRQELHDSFADEKILMDISAYNMENITFEGGAYYLRFNGEDLKNLEFPYIDVSKTEKANINIEDNFSNKSNTVTFYQNEEGNLIATEYIGDTLKEYMGFRLVQPKIYGVRFSDTPEIQTFYLADKDTTDGTYELITEEPAGDHVDVVIPPVGERYFYFPETVNLNAGDIITFNLRAMNFVDPGMEDSIGSEGSTDPISFMFSAENKDGLFYFESQFPADSTGEEYDLVATYTITEEDAITTDGKPLEKLFVSIINSSISTGEFGGLHFHINTIKSSISLSSHSTGNVYIKDAEDKTPGSAWEEEEPFKDIKYCTFKDGKVNYYLNKGNLYFKDGLVYAYENGELYVTEYTDNLIATEGKEYLEFSEYYMVERVNKYLDGISGAFPSLREANDFVQGTRKSAYSQEGNCIVTGYVRSEEGAGTEYWTDTKEAGEDFCFVCKQNPNTFYKYSQSLGYADANIPTHSLISAGDCYIYKNSTEEVDVYVTSYEEGFNSLLEQNFDTESGAFIINGEIFTWNSEENEFIKIASTATLNGADGDVMIEIPKMGYRISENAGGYLYVEITTAKDAEDLGFCYYAHEDLEKIYVGTYLSSLYNNELKSVAQEGNTPLTNLSIEHFRKLAQSKGEGYGLVDFYTVTLLQCLYLLYYCNRNSQESVGMGRVDGTTEIGLQPSSTGSTSTVGGLMVESADASSSIRCMGLEDFWGNAYWFVDGLKTEEVLIPNVNRFALITSKNCANIPINYSNKGIVSENNLNYPLIKKVQATNEKGFLPKEGTEIPGEGYWADGCSLNSNNGAAFIGGCKTSTDDFNTAGIFNLRLEIDENEARPTVGARLMYR